MFYKMKNLEHLAVTADKKNWHHVMQLLENQTYLDTLSFHYEGFPESRKPKLRSVPMVRHFIISSFLLTEPKFRYFIASFRGHVEYVTLKKSAANPSFETIQQVWDSVRGLNIAKKLPTHEISCKQARVNVNMTELCLKTGLNVAALLNIFRIFPKLKNLSIILKDSASQEVWIEDIERLQESFKNLENFRVQCPDDTLLEVEMTYLRHITYLEIQVTYPEFDWTVFKEAGADVKSLVIHYEESVDFEKILDTFPNVETMQLDTWIFQEKYLDILAGRIHKLQALHLVNANPVVKTVLKKLGIRLTLNKPILPFDMSGAFALDEKFF